MINTKESVLKLAKKCKTRKDFHLKYPSAYNFARKNNILEQACKDMIPSHLVRRNARLIWTFEKCKKEAKKYTNRTDFMRKSSRAYNVSLENSWIAEICSHMELQHKPNGFWTIEKCHELSKTCKDIKEFREKYSSAYVTAKNRKWLEKITLHMTIKKRKWTLAEVKKESKKFKTRTEFAKKASGAYTACLNNDWLKHCDSHFIRQIDNREERLQDIIMAQLNELGKKHSLEITKEYKVKINKTKYCRPDFLIRHKKSKKFLFIEVKHDDSFWTKEEIDGQIKMYNKSFKNDKKFKNTILVSKLGKYGLNIKELNCEVLKRIL